MGYREHRLMFPAEAQQTKVVRVEQLLSSSEISNFISDVKLLQQQSLCGRTQLYSKGPRKGWRTSSLHTDGIFQKRFAVLSKKLRRTIFEGDAANWKLLEGRQAKNLTFRTVEFHEYTPGGQLSAP